MGLNKKNPHPVDTNAWACQCFLLEQDTFAFLAWVVWE